LPVRVPRSRVALARALGQPIMNSWAQLGQQRGPAAASMLCPAFWVPAGRLHQRLLKQETSGLALAPLMVLSLKTRDGPSIDMQVRGHVTSRRSDVVGPNAKPWHRRGHSHNGGGRSPAWRSTWQARLSNKQPSDAACRPGRQPPSLQRPLPFKCTESLSFVLGSLARQR
jgi:hypothetical protein